jgi:hypothetical protein
MTGIIDEPLSEKEDQLGIESYYEALSNFICSTNTPITIGIQGEWGSGKTSLLNNIWGKLDEKEFRKIWVNTWEHSMLSTPEETLLKIIKQIISDITISDPDNKLFKGVKKASVSLFKGAARIGASVAGGQVAAQVVGDLMEENGDSDNQIRFLRESLSKAIDDFKSKKGIKGFVFFIDDLDRIEPKDAVKILELLKNIFNIKHCIFILAIDYQVVVKGLREKFGEMTVENEWEFRAFFDKIIQVPFTMPMGAYDLGNYVGHLLKEINFIDQGTDYSAEIEKIVGYSIGGNPRSLKRLANSLSLINMFKKDPEQKEDKLLMLALICLQVAYPKMYEQLASKPLFLEWDESDAYEFSRGRKSDQEDLERAMQTEDFDESWEQSIFKMCYPYPQLKNRAVNISRLFTWIRGHINDDSKLEDRLLPVLQNASITSVSADLDNARTKGMRKGYSNSSFWQCFLEKCKEIGVSYFNRPVSESALNRAYLLSSIPELKGSPIRHLRSFRCKSESIEIGFSFEERSSKKGLYDYTEAIETLKSDYEFSEKFGKELTWDIKEGRTYQYLVSDYKVDIKAQEKWPEYCELLITESNKLFNLIKDPIIEIDNQLKEKSGLND